MKWETPAFVEINMSAEIGGYGSDFTDRDPWGPVAPHVESAAKAARDAIDAARR
jgi:tRNA G26 N,N-dimethylase Trm1